MQEASILVHPFPPLTQLDIQIAIFKPEMNYQISHQVASQTWKMWHRFSLLVIELTSLVACKHRALPRPMRQTGKLPAFLPFTARRVVRTPRAD
jgi:hypothetical protein